ncbi:EAL domain-containing protein [Gallaecimonas kandeliae]|uniref:putative bifunctional diguanylate cyclase/phosphodiesterase n=1 Tax=Gallaecimonas kandeliae TaxID=3029055 RepID=UPI00264A470E|nr:EAL domain-containing protein [Gallaecimonas kandeliae]WKE65598.1 EAL domain-containing protein [Gallaecimonas kandeliae]
MTGEEDKLVFALEDEQQPVAGSWQLLVVDDDQEVHQSTRFALGELRILGRPLNLLHAHSAAEAAEILRQHQDIAVVLLDVVMESTAAGLELVRLIRQELGLTKVRLVLRTGQPGYAPELEVIERFDINDYRTKGELTQARLVATLTTALRAYQQIDTIEHSRQGLELVVKACNQLMKFKGLADFSKGVLTQIAGFLGLPPDGILCAEYEAEAGWWVVGAAGRLAEHIHKPLAQVPEPGLRHSVEKAVLEARHQFAGDHTVLYLASGSHQGVVYLATGRPLSAADRQLVELFAANIATCHANVRLMEAMSKVAYTDPLTGLYNRAGMQQQLDEDVAQGHAAVLALIDLDQFADVNDALGHETGNGLLLALARRLQEAFGQECQLARLHADVFAVLGPAALLQAQQLSSLLNRPFTANGQQLVLHHHLGFCPVTADAGSGANVLRRANIALNKAKLHLVERGIWFDDSMESDTAARLDLVRRLRQALDNEELAVHYQPQICLDSRKLMGMEALVRWPGGPGPGDFIPLAEYAGLIIPLGLFVLRRACRELAALDGQGVKMPHVSVNVSLAQFQAADFISQVLAALEDAGLAPHRLELEITESIAMEDPHVVVRTLRELKGHGIRVALDDFGTGYSSLGHLNTLPLDRLKIDRRFVTGLAPGQEGPLMSLILGVAKSLKLESIAEGVENSDELAWLEAAGCSGAQGYLFARPMGSQALADWLATWPQG